MTGAPVLPDPRPFERAALDTFDAIRRRLYDPERKIFHEDAGEGLNICYLWPLSQALAAIIDMADLTADTRFVDTAVTCVEAYWHPSLFGRSAYDSAMVPPLGMGGDVYYDDNAWIGLELLRAYAHTGKALHLKRARALFDLAVSGWDKDASHPCSGGIFWVRAAWNRDRGTVSTAANALFALNLYVVTSEDQHLAWARRMLGWVQQWMRAPSGLYWDKVLSSGEIDRTHWSYNQGSVVAASLLLARLDGQGNQLEMALETVRAALEYYGSGEAGGWIGQPLVFNALFFHHVLESVQDESLRARCRDEARRYLRSLSQALEWDGPLPRPSPGQPPTLLDSAALVRLNASVARASATPAG